MMKILSIISVLLLSININAQKSSLLFGQWQVVVMDNGVRYDYKTTNYTISQALSNKLKVDSNGLELEDYIEWAKSCQNCYFVFMSDSTYSEFREQEIKTEGTFSLNLKDSTINVFKKIGTNIIPVQYKYGYSGQRLILRVPSFFTKEDLLLELEKTN